MGPWFELCRLPWSLAVAADPLTGALIAGAGWRNIPTIGALMIGVALIHAGAAALNDWHDVKADRTERPGRPIPAGRVGRWWALLVACVLLASGWGMITISGGIRFSQVGLILLCTVLIYEFLLKEAPIARTLPGLARALALLAGLMVVPVADSPAGWGVRMFFMGTLALYSLGTMVVACRVEPDARRGFTIAGGSVAGVAVVALATERLFFPQTATHPAGAIWIGLLLVVAGYPMFRAIVRPGEGASRSAADAMMLGSILVDAAAVGFVRGVPLSLPVAALLVPVYYANGAFGSVVETVEPAPQPSETTVPTTQTP